jgi:multiple sugar transport system ATP-binding protein
MAEIALDRLKKVYPDGTLAVSSFSLDIADGELMVLVGPSGCGKSTVLAMVAGLEEVTEGTVTIGDRTMNDVEPRDRDIAMVFQNYALYPHMSVYRNIAFGLRMRKLDRAEIDRRVNDAARVLGLSEDLFPKKPKQLSGGQRQRVAMGRALVRDPQAFLMDEPLSNLDAKLRIEMRSEIASIQRELGVTTIYVTHDQTEATVLGDRLAVMRDGVLQQVGRPDDVYRSPANLFVAGFIGSPAMNAVAAELERDDHGTFCRIGNHRIRLDDTALPAPAQLQPYIGRRVVLGIRPEDMEDASLEAGAPQDRRISVVVDRRETVGREAFVHFTLDAPGVGVQGTIGAGSDERSTRTLVATIGARTCAEEGDRLELIVDVSSVHLFDPETGVRISG